MAAEISRVLDAVNIAIAGSMKLVFDSDLPWTSGSATIWADFHLLCDLVSIFLMSKMQSSLGVI